ncbi:MAG: hypothetical protein KME26_29840, partial [Oscillatoria princeps RMCB-10]|nr:hypothetical protein [Oscillatoria princeps RMCB-10]
AQKLLGNANRWREIYREKTGRFLTDADAANLQIGEWLVFGTTPTPTPTPTPSNGRYQVKAGDNPSSIAQKLLGNANRWREIYREKTGRFLTDADAANLQIGEWLVFGTTPTPTPTPTPSNKQPIIDAVNKVNPEQAYYQPHDIIGDGTISTFCNWFAADVLECFGVAIPRQTNSPYKMNPPVFGGANRDKPISAEQLYTFFNNGGEGKWQKVTAADAAAKANNGQAVVACGSGHIAIVIPGSSASDVRIAQAGKTNGKNMSVSQGFGSNPFLYFAYVG